MSMTRSFSPVPSSLRSRLRRTIPSQWHSLLVSAAIGGALCLASTHASALAFGQFKKLSALGEPLRAEVEILEITPAEAEGLRVNLASQEAYGAAGFGYNPALSSMRVNLERNSTGRYVVKLAGSQPVNEPFVDVVLEAHSTSGRIVRDYTVLLDPAASSPQAAPVAPIAPQTDTPPRAAPAPTPAPRSPAPQPTASQPPASQQAVQPQPSPAPVAARPAPAPTEPAVARQPQPAPRQAAPVVQKQPPVQSSRTAREQQLTVKHGDTAGKIARENKPDNISLDQMLVAMLRTNPDAFVRNNVNRMKAGAVIDIPSAQQAASVPQGEARRMIVAQSRDFNEYRRRLAENARNTSVARAGSQASGKLQANVSSNATSSSPDRLTVSRGRPSDEKLVTQRKAQDEKSRIDELSKNLKDLNQLQAAGNTPAPTGKTPPAGTAATAAPGTATSSTATTTPAAPSSATTSSAPATAAVPATATAPATTTPAAPPSSTATAPSTTAATPEGTSGSTASSSSPSSAPTITTSALPPTSASETPPASSGAPATPPASAGESNLRGFMNDVLHNPIALAGIAAAVLLLVLLAYLLFGRRKSGIDESVFQETRVPKDSFFGASGGESVDTKIHDDSSASTLPFTPSQLDAAEVDPVAEADVYLAYGRDMQAEEILREALRIHPERTAIHLKLLEIHAKRRDLKAYETLALDVKKLTQGTGDAWSEVIELGRSLDPNNPLYQTAPAAANAPAEPQAASQPPAFAPAFVPLDFNLDLGELKESQGAPAGNTLQPSSIATPSEGIPSTGGSDDPHAIKLALARELHSLGNLEGARTLAKEVISNGDDAVRNQAYQFLNELR